MKRSVFKTMMLLVALLAVSSASAQATQVQTTAPKCQNAHAVLGWWTFSREFKPVYWHLFWSEDLRSRIDLPVDDGRPIDPATKEPVRGYAVKYVDVWFKPRRPGLSTLQIFGELPPEKLIDDTDELVEGEKKAVDPNAEASSSATAADATGVEKSSATAAVATGVEKKEAGTPTDGKKVVPTTATEAETDTDETDEEEPLPELWKAISEPQQLDWRRQPVRIHLSGGKERYGALQLRGAGARFEVTKVIVRYPDWEKRILQKPWDKVGWILGRRKYLKQVEAPTAAISQQASFWQYRVAEREHSYAYVANCGAGSTCNEIASAFFKHNQGVGTPRVYCGALPPQITSPVRPTIRIPTDEEMAAALDLSDDISFDDDEDDDDLDFD